MKSLTASFFSPVRLLPAFAIVSVLGCLAGRFVFGIPLDQLGVVVSVWMVCAFVFSRILILVVPRRHRATTVPKPSMLVVQAVSAITLVAMMLGPVFFASGVIYGLLGLTNASTGSLHLAVVCFAVIGIDVVGYLLSSATRNAMFKRGCVMVYAGAIHFFWSVLRGPTEISRAVHLEHLRVHH